MLVKQENGPIRMAEGTTSPILNEYGWTTSSDMVSQWSANLFTRKARLTSWTLKLYIEQPVGTGFTSYVADYIQGIINLMETV